MYHETKRHVKLVHIYLHCGERNHRHNKQPGELYVWTLWRGATDSTHMKRGEQKRGGETSTFSFFLVVLIEEFLRGLGCRCSLLLQGKTREKSYQSVEGGREKKEG